MKHVKEALLFGACILLTTAILAVPVAQANPDPCLVVYPDSPCEYHYEAAEYYTVSSGHPLYDPMYDRGGLVLIEVNTDDIAYDVYQAPNLIGFVLDNMYQGYFVEDNDFGLVIDGWSNQPTTYVNILIVFDLFEPSGCIPDITIDGNPVLFDPGLGWYWPIGDLVVTTATPNGNNYSDTITVSFHWENCYSLRAYAFSDENFNLQRDGDECKSAFSHDTTIPVQEETWGAVKDTYSR